MPYTYTKPIDQDTLSLEYHKLAQGLYKYLPTGMGIFSYYADRGSNVTTNEFWDPTLVGSKSEKENIMSAIKSAKKAGFLALEIQIKESEYKVIAQEVAEIAIESQKKISITYPSNNSEGYLLFVKINE